LTPIEKFESLLLELIDYLKATLVPIEDPDGQISYTCTKDNYNDPDYMEPFKRVANFCIEKNLNPHEVIDMIDEYTGDQYNCECYLLEDKKIKNLVQKFKKEKNKWRKE
jgi:hypothetical protein